MFCTKCGKQNVTQSKYCVYCGALLEEPGNVPPVNGTNNLNAGGLRKALKAEAKAKPKGAFIGFTALWLVITAIISGVISGCFGYTYDDVLYLPYWAEVLQGVLTVILSSLLSYGIISSGLDLLRGGSVTFGSIINKVTSSFSKALMYMIVSLVIYIVLLGINYLTESIALLGSILSLVFLVFIIWFTPAMQTFLCILADDKVEKLDLMTTLKKALNLVKGHRVEYYGMVCSFIGWLILGIFTLGILYIWLVPYMQLSVANMYRRWIGETNINTNQSGLSNGSVIGLSVGGGCGCFIVFVLILAAILVAVGITTWNELEDGIEISTSTITSSSGEAIIGEGDTTVTFLVPSGFEEAYEGNDETYSSFYDDNYNSITYSYYDATYYSADEVYSDEVESMQSYRYTDYGYEDTDFTFKLKGNEVKCHLVKETTNYDTVYYELVAVYSIDDSGVVVIDVSINEEDGTISEDNVKDYINIK